MKKFLLFAGTIAVGIGFANAAVRDTSSITRQTGATQSAQNITARTGDARAATPRAGTVTTRTAARTQSRATSRAATTTTARTARNTVQSTAARTATTAKSARTATNTVAAVSSIARAARTPARAATTTASNTFGTGYNTCRDAYFSCMDQFCAKQNDTYRRCVCSARLNDIQARERTLSQTSDQLQDFKDLNIEVIPKTGAEVKAMLNATAGETIAANARDKSDSAQKLAGISEVLSNTKSKALSTQGTLDIAGDINAIWATTDLASGAQIANLTGESLYNAVHSQCVELIASQCASTATLNMVVSAYGMYIENDCTALSTALDKKYTQANAAIRAAESEMHTARLENYDAHNSTSINDCIAQVRKDITADTACGTNYVHCLDVSGRYLNRDTGEPIYTADFYQLESSISLSGDILNNQANRMIVNELNNKRAFAARGLETCRDLADEVWDEFMRQAITEIYQGQHERIRQVKNECLDVVNQCYDTQSQSLKDFSNVKEQLLLGSRLELSEEMCREKLSACANLYGGGSKGMTELVNTMKTITDQKIAQQCQTTLMDYAKEMCAVPSNDSLHAYPFGCRTYNPGSMYYAAICPATGTSVGTTPSTDNKDDETEPQRLSPSALTQSSGYSCPAYRKYTDCSRGYYMAKSATNPQYDGTPRAGNACLPCDTLGRSDCTCAGGTSAPICGGQSICGDYEGSLYQKLVRYAQQTCVRPSESSDPLPSSILQDVNVVMDSIKIEMARELAKECERLGGIWIDTERDDIVSGGTSSALKAPSRSSGTGADTIFDKQTHATHKKFYIETSASTKWGYCASPDNGTVASQKEGCTTTGGTWSDTKSECTCNTYTVTNAEGISETHQKLWNATAMRCVYPDSKTACEQTGGTYGTTCTCPTGKTLNTTTYECE
ncbi:MAG: hypothetical protein K2I81_02020 [Alphaproteobacteria bacterium]|nr:hypothetical protein [Alphaproteobacteria bacterium]